MRIVIALFQLTKPMIMILVVVSGATALVIEGSFLSRPDLLLLFLVGLYLTGGSANAFNQYLERDIDSKMSRTRDRRPLPLQILRPRTALLFAVAIGISGIILFFLVFNWLTALLAFGTIVFYGFFYTLWLKPNTDQNIVIGGIAGAMAPVGAWAAATGSISAIAPWLIFLIIFFWTPPHFWSLAMRLSEDYRRAKLPMMPLVRGFNATVRQMRLYGLALISTTLIYGIFLGSGIFLLIGGGLSLIFVLKIFGLRKARDFYRARRIFVFSIIYLFGLFSAMILDKFVSI